MIKNRNMGMQIVLYVITFGIYGIYWFYVSSKEMVEYKKLEGSPGLWTVLFLIPIVNLYSYWKHSETVDALTDGQYNKILMFVLWIFINPVAWALTQIELNKRATAPT